MSDYNNRGNRPQRNSAYPKRNNVQSKPYKGRSNSDRGESSSDFKPSSRPSRSSHPDYSDSAKNFERGDRRDRPQRSPRGGSNYGSRDGDQGGYSRGRSDDRPSEKSYAPRENSRDNARGDDNGYSGRNTRNGRFGGNRGGDRPSRSRSYGGSRSGARGGFGGGSRGGFGGRSSGGRGGKSRFKGNKIDERIYTQIAHNPEEIEEKKQTEIKFSDINLDPKIQAQLAYRGFEYPTEIQAQLIPEMLAGHDVVAISQTGSGKTGAFILPILDQYVKNQIPENQYQTLIIAPTRELAFQIEKELFNFGLKKLRLFSLICVGGTNMGQQIRNAKMTNQFIVGTPGRIIDLMKQGYIKADLVKNWIVDEMDRMLDMGFINDLDWISQQLPKNIQKGFFSATFDPKIKPLLNKFVPDAKLTQISNPKPSLYVEQSMIRVDRNQDKIDVLLDHLEQDKGKSIIFVNTKSETEKVHRMVQEAGYYTDFIHGDRPQRARTRIIKKYRTSPDAILVATDVAARGLDIDDVTHVYNYDEPHTEDDYIHRIGRTGRAGRTGTAKTFVKR